MWRSCRLVVWEREAEEEEGRRITEERDNGEVDERGGGGEGGGKAGVFDEAVGNGERGEVSTTFNKDSFSVSISHTIGVSTPVYAVSRAGGMGEKKGDGRCVGWTKDAAATPWVWRSVVVVGVVHTAGEAVGWWVGPPTWPPPLVSAVLRAARGGHRPGTNGCPADPFGSGNTGGSSGRGSVVNRRMSNATFLGYA